MKITCFPTTQKAQSLLTKKKNQPECYKRRQSEFPTVAMQDSQISPRSKILLLKTEIKYLNDQRSDSIRVTLKVIGPQNLFFGHENLFSYSVIHLDLYHYF